MRAVNIPYHANMDLDYMIENLKHENNTHQTSKVVIQTYYLGLKQKATQKMDTMYNIVLLIIKPIVNIPSKQLVGSVWLISVFWYFW